VKGGGGGRGAGSHPDPLPEGEGTLRLELSPRGRGDIGVGAARSDRVCPACQVVMAQLSWRNLDLHRVQVVVASSGVGESTAQVAAEAGLARGGRGRWLP
jgi:hypothetical protein